VRNCWALRMCRPVSAMSGLLILNAIAWSMISVSFGPQVVCFVA
jgi:hypothetical protein